MKMTLNFGTTPQRSGEPGSQRQRGAGSNLKRQLHEAEFAGVSNTSSCGDVPAEAVEDSSLS